MEGETVKTFSFLIMAGGSGSRIGGCKKQFRPLSGRPLWRWSADLVLSMADEGIAEVVLVLPEDELGQASQFDGLRVVPGGPTRPDSVKNGLSACSCEYVMVHDAARPFVGRSLLLRLMERTTEDVGAVPVMPVAEAVKRIEEKEGTKVVTAVDRKDLFVTQTPQCFPRRELAKVLDLHGAVVRDEAEAWLAAGRSLVCVEGERFNFKVTWSEDLSIAEALARTGVFSDEEALSAAAAPEELSVRTGIGYDVHRLVPERPLILGGVLLEDAPLGLLGHSDADVLAHTVSDALLGAAGCPDIGNLFPASDERYKNADSMELLLEVVERVKGEGWRVLWVDAVLTAQVPRLNERLPEMGENLSRLLNAGVNVKAKSPEGTDAPGAARSIACWAVATLKRERRHD
ncbi:MAG: 2-C-methyl-D-erythritol 2,4-cyclodiphosphate synthase [Fretibacterium sp.]|nr:2-C-methyl-D-erythritol 2,4-cyclodiphosphate synthase [Fretibacterium sp.]